MRWITPTEGAAEGQTLGCVLLWLLTGIVWSWKKLKTNAPSRKPDLVDIGIGMIITGHILSTAGLFYSGGQLRYAQNLCWEWVGLGATYLVLREAVQSPQIKQSLLTLTAIVGISLSAFGIWQHYVWYEQASQQYQTLKQEYLELSAKPANLLTSDEKQRLIEVRQEFTDQGIPIEQNALQSWENRLLSSREPLGFFALTNTFAAILLLTTLLLLPVIRHCFLQINHTKRLQIFVIISFTLVLFCLLLTKSRTAWIALIFSLSVFIVWSKLKRPNRTALSLFTRKEMFAFSGIALGLLLITWLAGGIDKLVILEAPKSVQYRLNYWKITSQILVENPALGTGPGNFRSYYQQLKPPAASEEITDPHNFLLDLWASGGILSLFGLGIIVWGCVRFRKQTTHSPEDIQQETYSTTPLFIGGLGAFGVLACYNFLSLSGDILPVIMTGLIACGLLLGWFKGNQRPVEWFQSNAVTFSILTLAVLGIHLTGSGGIEMPAVVQILILALVLLLPAPSNQEAPPSQINKRLALGSGLVLSFGLIYTAILPTLNCSAALAQGERLMLRNQEPDEVIRSFEQAAKFDPWSPLPNQRLGEFYLQICSHLNEWEGKHFNTAEANFEEALARDSRNPRRYWQLAQLYSQKYQAKPTLVTANLSVHYFQEAVDRYPNFAPLRAEYALALSEMGREKLAKSQASTAYSLNTINKEQNHLDLLLDSAQLKRLEHIIKPH